MSNAFLKKWVVGSCSLLLVLGSFSFLSGHAFFGWGLIAGGGWSLLNLLLLGELVPLILQPERKPLLMILFFGFLKLLLYGGGAALLWWVPLSKIGILIGFSVPLLFVSIQAMVQAGRMAGGLFRLGRIHG